MVASNGLSCVLALTLSTVLTASMQMYRQFLSSSQPMTILTGFLGSLLFLLILTAISNLEMTLFGKHFQSKLTEVILSLVIAMFVSGGVHRVAITTCLIFSVIGLYYVNRISIRVHQINAINPQIANNPTSKKRK
ncbi:protein KRTCAP2 homolog [Oppia nitens]|uniref:protein KRTCAP2 homolog n=1 Tax=Oppia nitens TaxID=1686743 RepID=UPI0023DA6506|nr:protein KRTCAP2 homolog [Oppia nitens]